MVSRELETWIENQHPKQVKHLNGGEPSTVYHLSDCDSIKRFSPRLPMSCKHKEDTTIPRICGSLSLKGCFLGIPHHLNEGAPALILTLYKFPKYEIIVPGKNLTGVNVTWGEVWLVPYRLSIWDIVPERVATFRLESVTKASKVDLDQNVELVYIGCVYGEVLDNGKPLAEYCRVTFKPKDQSLVIQSASDGADAFEKANVFHNVLYFS